MSFLAPLFLVGALAATVPIVLHFLRREPDVRVKFAPVALLKRAPVEHAARRRLRDLLLLGLRVAMLVLLAAAFARPYVAQSTGEEPTGLSIVALDTSLSMSGPGQFERARQAAVDAIAAAPAGQMIAVLTFATTAQIAAPPSSDRAMARAAVAAARPGLAATSYRPLFVVAAGLLSEHPRRTNSLAIVTDMQALGWDPGEQATVPEGTSIDVVDVGPPPPNLAVTDAWATPRGLAATVRNWGPEPREVHVALSGEQEATRASTLVQSGGSADVVFPDVAGSTAVVSIEDPEGVEADNRRYVVLGAEGLPAVAVVTGTGALGREAFYLGHALGTTPAGDRSFGVTGVGASELSSWDQARVDGLAAIVVLSTRGLDTRGRERLEKYIGAGGGVLVAAGPDLDGRLMADALGGSLSIDIPAGGRSATNVPRSLAPADVRHPIFRRFGAGSSALGLVTFTRVAALRSEECETLARFTSGEAALVECALGGRAVVLASDLDGRWNDFPVHSTYLPFVHEVVRYLIGQRSHAQEYLVGQGPAGIPAEPGVVRVGDGAGRSRWIAVNVDPNESNPARVTVDEFLGAVTQLGNVGREASALEAEQQEDRQRLWRVLLGMVVAVMVLESIVATRAA